MSTAAPAPNLKTLNDLALLVARREAPEVMRYKRAGEWHGISAAEFHRQLVRVARGLQRLGVQPGDRVALLSENRPEWAIADFAILGSGAINVPLYTTSTPASLEYILKDSGSKIIFVSSETHREKIRAVEQNLPGLRHIILFDAPMSAVQVFATNLQEVAGGPPRDLSWRDLVGDAQLASSEITYFERGAQKVSADDLASIIYTSGTTGTPKGVMLTHSNIVSNVVSGPVENLGPQDVALSFLPLCHIYERTADYIYFFHGVVVAYAESIEAVPQNLQEVRPTVVAAVPRLFEKMYARVLDSLKQASGARRRLFWWAVGVGREALKARIEGRSIDNSFRYRAAERLVFRKLRARVGGRLRYFISGGAPLSRELAEFFNAAGIPICEGYGLTETSPVVATNIPTRIRPGTVGRPIPGVEVRIADDGEILVRGPNVMKGYYNQPEETARVLKDGWLYTGDIGEITAEGDLRVTDRKKDLLKTAGGKFVAPQPIENRLRQSPYIANALVVGDRRPCPAALIVPDYDQVAAFARQQGIGYSSHEELARHSAVRSLLRDELEKVNAGLAQFEQIKFFDILDKDFTIESGELTPTMKVRRSMVEQRFRDRIDALYAAQS